MAEIEEFPVKKDLTVVEAAAYAERRNAQKGIVLFYNENEIECFCTFGDLKNSEALWLLEMQKVITLKLLDAKET